MPLVSVTRLRLHRLRDLPQFGFFAILSYIQARRAAGNARVLTLRDRRLTFWTITVWQTPEAMKAFRNTSAHLKAMPRLAEWCDEATYVHWSQDSDAAPEPKLAFERLVKDGVVSRVKDPSANHAARNFERPKWA
jgi:hypothetical protein